jgi:hypothetical protein
MAPYPLRELADGNTPTGVISVKLGRSEHAIRAKAQAEGTVGWTSVCLVVASTLTTLVLRQGDPGPVALVLAGSRAAGR